LGEVWWMYRVFWAYGLSPVTSSIMDENGGNNCTS